MNIITKKPFPVLLIILILIGGFLRIFPIEYSAMRMYDNQLVGEALDLGDGIFKGDFSVLEQPVKYPYFFSYILLFFYGIFFIFGKLVGLFSSGKEFTAYIFLHINSFYDFARILVGIAGTALIPLTYFLTKKIVSHKDKSKAKIAGILASFLMTFNLLHIHFSHQERAHIWVSFLMFLTFYFFILCLEKKRLVDFLLLGFGAGAVSGSLQVGVFSLVFFLLLLIFSKFKYLASFKFWAGVLVFIAIVVLCYPFLLLAFNKIMAFWNENFHSSITGEGKTGISLFIFTTLKQIFVYQSTLIIVFVGFLVLWILFRNKKKTDFSPLFKRSILGAAMFIIVYFLAFGFVLRPYSRMLSPIMPFLCLLSGIMFIEIYYSIKIIQWKRVFIGLLGLLLAFSIIQPVRFSYLMFKPETRDIAKAWIEENISKEDFIALGDDFMRFALSKKSLQMQSEIDPKSLSRKDKFLFESEDEFYSKETRNILNYWAVKSGDNQYQILKENKIKYFVAFGPTLTSVIEDSLEKDIIANGGKLLEMVSPFREGESGYCDFPREFVNPIIDLWSIKNLGQVIKIYKL